MKLKAIPVCPGKVLAQSYVLGPVPEFDLEAKQEIYDEESTRQCIDAAMQAVMAKLEANKAASGGNEDMAAMLDVQKSMLGDSYYLEEIYAHTAEGYAPHAAVLRAAKTQIDMLQSLQDEMMSARAEDMKDASTRLAVEILGLEYPDISCLPGPVLLVGEDLFPSILLNADFGNLKGIVTRQGTRTSHVSILAASVGVPMLVGCAEANLIEKGQMVYMDAAEGSVEFGLDAAQIENMQAQVAQYQQEKAKLQEYASRDACTADGERVQLCANIIEPLMLEQVLEHGMDGIGLFRTEFLYMNRNTLPGEEEQFTVYKMVAEKLQGKPVIIRTMDIGGDKEVEALGLPPEENPFMGFRAIRICLERTDIFAAQLRAILRASAFGNIRVMFPMVAAGDELDRALQLLGSEREKLDSEGIAYDKQLKTGIMIEIPSAVVMMDKLVEKVDFVSIGSNDLVQYLFAADRLNRKVEYLYNFMHPAVLRMIKHTIDEARKAGVECSLCGEMAGDALGMAALAALGLKKFSVSASLALARKRGLSLLNVEELAKTGDKILETCTAQEAVAVLKEALPHGYC